MEKLYLAFFIIGLVIFLSSLIYFIYLLYAPYKRNRIFKPFSVLLSGIILTGICIFIPIYTEDVPCLTFWDAVKIFLYSGHNTLRLFMVDGDFYTLLLYTSQLSDPLKSLYEILAGVIYIMAPFFLFGTILSFFEVMRSFRKLYLSPKNYFKKEIHIFSELNEKSLSLAASIRDKEFFLKDYKTLNKEERKKLSRYHQDIRIVFTGVIKNSSKEMDEYIERAKEMDAILFQKEISTIKFNVFPLANKKIFFYVMNKEEESNIEEGRRIINDYLNRKATYLYIFASSISSELQLQSLDNDSELIVRCINVKEAVVYNFLFNQGGILFDKAIDVPGKNKQINVAVFGMGDYGQTIIKCLAWFCQMDGYDLTIHAFDDSSISGSMFIDACPELMDEKHNGNFTNPEEARYNIVLYPGMNVKTDEFDKTIENLGPLSYVFISLGSNNENVSIAAKMSVLSKRLGYQPLIQTISNTSELSASGVAGKEIQKYDIAFIGSLYDTYREDILLNPVYEKFGLNRHLSYYGDEVKDEKKKREITMAFFHSTYSYRSSISSAIHFCYRVYCDIPGVDIRFKELGNNLTPEQASLRYYLNRLEHRRWNTFLRTEGWKYYPERLKNKERYKLHPDLVPFNELSKAEQDKDDYYSLEEYEFGLQLKKRKEQ